MRRKKIKERSHWSPACNCEIGRVLVGLLGVVLITVII